VTSTVFIPIYGKLSDLFGRKPTLISGMVIFLTGSLLCGLATSPFFLILARAVQGCGSAALFTNAFAVVADIFPPAERGKYQGMFGAVWGFSSVVGPLAGGFITDYIGWNWAFFINLPVGAVALGFVITRMPRLAAGPVARARASTTPAPWRWPARWSRCCWRCRSAAAPTRAPSNGWPWASWQIAALFALSLVAGGVLIAIEKRASAPIIDLRLFGSKPFAVGVAATFVTGGAFLASIVFLPLFMTNVVGLSATKPA
jgi:MFS family permease